MFDRLSLSVFENALTFAMVESIAPELSARSLSARLSTESAFPDMAWTLSTMARTLSASTALTSLSASSDSACRRVASGSIVLPRSARPFSAASTPPELLASAIEKVWTFSIV